MRAALVILILAVALIGTVWWFFHQQSNEETNGKSPSEMRAATSLPFPCDASNIHYFFHAGGLQDLKIFGKFDCPANRADEIVAEFIAYNDQQLERIATKLPARQTVTAAPFRTLGSGDFELRWWDLDERKVRKAVLLNESHLMQFWIEPSGNDGAIIYFYQSD